MNDVMTAAARRAGEWMPRTVATADGEVLLFDAVGSTNTVARELIAGGRRIAVIATDEQTAGRGRLDHTWTSAAGESFTVSFAIVVPRAVATDASVNGWLQMIAGLSALDALHDVVRHGTRAEACDDVCTNSATRMRDDADGLGDAMPCDDADGPDNAALQLKWPNDIFCDGKKLGGILAEMVFPPNEPQSVALIFGIGLNIAVPADRLPTAQATSLQLHWRLDGTTDDVRDAIAARIVAALRSRIARFVADPQGDARDLLAETRGVCWTLDHDVEAHFTDGSTLRGIAVALNDDASLTIRDVDGNVRIVRTADVGVLG